MKTIIKTYVPFIAIGLLLACLEFSPEAQAVVPPPDGGYPGGNTAEGQNALQSTTTGGFNAAVGYFSLFANTTGSFNTAVGAGALDLNTGDNNTAVGAAALLLNTTGTENTATGTDALVYNDSGSQNTANGALALVSNTTGGGNTAIGPVALLNNTTGNDNIALGNAAGLFLTTGDDNIDIGNNGVAGESDTIRIGTIQGAIYLAGIAGQIVGAGGTTCYVDNDGKLGVFLSSRRFKTDIADIGAASEALLALRPVTFHYKPELDKTCIPQFGLVAEEVAQVNPDLVTRDAKGELSTVRYEAVNAMLLNEFLKEHRKIEQQERQIQEEHCKVQEQQVTINKLNSTVAQQQEEMKVFAASLKKQASQIQKVTAQLKVSTATPQIVSDQ